MRRVMLATPAYDGRVDANFAYSLALSIKLCAAHGIELLPVFWPGEALVQHARNMLVHLAVEANGIDDIVFIDADQAWDPKDLIKLLSHAVSVVGVAVRKKSDQVSFNVHSENGQLMRVEGCLLEVDGIGTGLLRMDKRAFRDLYNHSPGYRKGDQNCKMIFSVTIENGVLVGEDIAMCKTLRKNGYKIYVDPTISVSHFGIKDYKGNFLDYLRTLSV